jgi:ribosome-associated heat shock protein Hsp15
MSRGGRGAPGAHDDDDERDDAPPGKARLDKWLWAARFFKTRGLAAEAIDGGKVSVNGDRAKRARLVGPGDELAIRIGAYEHVVRVRGVALRRGSATVAQELYEETAESRAARESLAAAHKAAAFGFSHHEGKPSKKERRDLDRARRGR